MKILAIVGSPRPDGNSNYLVDTALKEASNLGAETEKIVLSDYRINPCLGHDDCASRERCTEQDDMEWISEKLCDADGIILATPVYYYNVTAQMKAFIDRNYFIYEKGRKPRARAVGIIVVANSEGIEDTMHTLKFFARVSFDVPKERRFIVTGYVCKIGDAEKNLPLVADAKELGGKMVKCL